MDFNSKHKSSEIESLLDKAKNDYTVKQYTDYAGYNADTSRPSNTISFVGQDNSIWVQGKQYSMNAGCYVGSDASGISTTGNWFLAGELTIKQAFDVNVVGSVQRTLGSGACGFFALGVRGSSTGAVINQFQWLCKVGGSIPQLRVVVNGFSVKLYCNVFGGQYAYGHIRIYNQCNRYNKDDNKVCFFTLADSTTIIPEADVPSGTDIAGVPYLSKDGTAVQSNKVWYDFTDTTNEDMRVLLGRGNNNKDYDPVFKSSGLTYNPNSKTLTAPTIKNPNGSWVHAAEGVAGQSGYVKVATIKINTVLTDQPLAIQFTGRNYLVPEKIYIRFNSENNKDPALASFYYESGSTRFGEYLRKSAAGTWDLYIKKGQGWDKIIVLSCENPYAFLSPNPNYSITWQDELVTTLPTDYVESIMSTKRIHITGNAATATKATQDENGVVIAENYQRVYKSSFHVTADGWYKLAYRPRTVGELLDWKDKYILVDVLSRQGGACNASFKILYSSHAGWMATANNEFMCIPLTTTNYACISNVRLLSKPTSVLGDSYIELYVQLSKGGNNASTDVEISIESNIPDTYLYNTATAGEIDTSAYTVITRNAVTSAYGGSSAVGGLVAEKSLSTNKLATSRKIGFASFDGTADVSLNTMQGKFQLRWTTNTTQWMRVIRFKTNATYIKNSLVIAIQDIESFYFSGLLSVYIGTTSSVRNVSARINWIALNHKNGDFSRAFRAYATYPTDTDEYVYVDIYVNSQLQYINMQFNVLTVYDTDNLTIGNSGTWLEESAITGGFITESKASVAGSVANDLEIRINGKQKATFDGSSAKTVNIEASKSHFVKASMYGEGWTSPPAGATTPGVPLILDTSYMIPLGVLQDGDTIIMQVPNTLTSTSGYPVYLRLDTTQGNVAGNLVKIIKAQKAGTPVEWKGTTALTAGYYHFVYSEGAGGLIFMYRNVSTS